MHSKIPSKELFELFDAILADRATDQQFQCLEDQLAESETIRQQFVEFSRLDVDLRHTFRTGAIQASVHPVIAAQSSPTPVRRFVRLNDLIHVAAVRWIGVGALAIAACWLALIHFDWSGPRENKDKQIVGNFDNTLQPVALLKPPGPVATLAGQLDVEWSSRPFAVGQAIRQGDEIALDGGQVRISVGIGAEIAARGPCSLHFLDSDRVQLNHGEVTVNVAEWATGFTVVTNAMEVVDLGTTFTVAASPNAEVETSVLKGQVRVSPSRVPASGPRSVLVSAGEAFAVDRDGNLNRHSVHFSKTDLAAMSLQPAYRPIALFNTGVGYNIGDEDPHWQLVADCDGPLKSPLYAVVVTPHLRYMPNEPNLSQWISWGDWQHCRANTVYTFRTHFDLSGYDLLSIQFFGRFLADNGIREVRVNGKSVEVDSWSDNVFGQSFGNPQFRTIDVTDELAQGFNELEIDVWNGTFEDPSKGNVEPNPMALRVEWYAFGRQDLRAAGDTKNLKSDKNNEKQTDISSTQEQSVIYHSGIARQPRRNLF